MPSFENASTEASASPDTFFRSVVMPLSCADKMTCVAICVFAGIFYVILIIWYYATILTRDSATRFTVAAASPLMWWRIRSTRSCVIQFLRCW